MQKVVEGRRGNQEKNYECPNHGRINHKESCFHPEKIRICPYCGEKLKRLEKRLKGDSYD